MSTMERISELWAETTVAPPEQIDRSTPLRSGNDEMDSLELADFFMSVEEEFETIRLSDALCATLNTLGEVADAVDRQLEGLG
jgi:acyl carrier protein